jgi:hypothetical protein
MRAVVIVLVVLGAILAFIGCLDRGNALRNAGGKENNHEVAHEEQTDSNRIGGSNPAAVVDATGTIARALGRKPADASADP